MELEGEVFTVTLLTLIQMHR